MTDDIEDLDDVAVEDEFWECNVCHADFALNADGNIDMAAFRRHKALHADVNNKKFYKGQ